MVMRCSIFCLYDCTTVKYDRRVILQKGVWIFPSKNPTKFIPRDSIFKGVETRNVQIGKSVSLEAVKYFVTASLDLTEYFKFKFSFDELVKVFYYLVHRHSKGQKHIFNWYAKVRRGSLNINC